jgi:predicted DNA-binding transcriptional regulator AlpA
MPAKDHLDFPGGDLSTRSADDGHIVGHGPPAYLSCASLARQLDCSKSTVHELVRQRILPKPLRLSQGTVRWRWADVDQAISSLNRETESDSYDPFMKGVRNVKEQK